MSKNSTLIGCDIFSGAGGISIGAEKAGVTVKLAIESDIHAANTFKLNHPNSIVLQEDIRKIDPTEHFSTHPFIVFGGPPCQGFSHSNTVTRNSKNRNNSLFNQFVRFINELEPEWFVFENVEGFTDFSDGQTVKKLEAAMKKLGYTTQKSVLSACNYGVPQDRKRFFMVGNRKDIVFKFPKPSNTINNRITVKEALHDLPILRNGSNFHELPYRCDPNSDYAELLRKKSKASKQNYVSRNQDYVIERYKYIKPGQNWEAIPARLMKNYAETENCHSGIYKRLHPGKPSVVISNYRKNMLIHPSQNRGLSVREAARLQSFPDNFIFEGSLTHIQQQIGNAVPPILAEKIFNRIMKSI